jgi:nitrogen fixation/metabolism regulation signal transduction histidine kinase
VRGASPRILLFALVAVVPVVVALAFVAAVLLQRAGFGLVVWALVPFVVSMLLIAGLGVVLGRAAVRSSGGSSGGRSRKDDGV